MKRLLFLWQSLRSSLWFIPGSMVLLAVGLGIGLIEVDTRLDQDFLDRWPRLFGAGAAGSRGILVTIAGSMITVAGVVFSITLVALSLASSQYTSRVLRNFMTDRTNQAVLGVFVGIFAYCLVVLRAIREAGATEFVPSFAVLAAVLLAFVGIGVFIYFVHHIATVIQASHILARIAADTIERVDQLFPASRAEDTPDSTRHDTPIARDGWAWHSVPAARTGYIQRADVDALLGIACDCDATIRMEHAVGDFVIEGLPVATALSASQPNAEVLGRISRAYTIDQQRTTDQDAAYGIRQIVDVALKALSPGINDTTTGIMSLDYLTAILIRLCTRPIASPWRVDQGTVRVLTRGVTFASLVELSFSQIRCNARENVAVLSRLLRSLELLEVHTLQPDRRETLWRQALVHQEVIGQAVAPLPDHTLLRSRAALLIDLLHQR